MVRTPPTETEQSGPIVWKVVHLVSGRPPSERNREDRASLPALERMRHSLDSAVHESGIIDRSPVRRICFVIGIDECKPKPPWLGRFVKKNGEQPVFLEFDWREVRDWTEAHWYDALVPMAQAGIVLVARKHKLSLAGFQQP